MMLALVGDIGLFGTNSILNQEEMINRFSAMESILSGYDIVIGNLESPLTSSKKPIGGKSVYLKASTEDVALLKYLHISHVNLANNHMFDYGQSGFEETLQTLEKNSIAYFGVNRKSEYLDIAGARIALHGFCCYSSTPRGIMKRNSKTGIHPYIPVTLPSLISADKQRGYLSILSVHAGEEHVHYPSSEHIFWARKLAEHAPYIYYGHHPHVLQGIEEYQRSLIAHSLGNFCFDHVYTDKSDKPLLKFNEDNQKTCILSIEIQDDMIRNWEIIPIRDNGKKIEKDSGLSDEIRMYSDYISIPSKEYKLVRKSRIEERINKKKMQRDLSWYLKRMKLDSIKHIVQIIHCRSKYKKYILKRENRIDG